MENLPTTKQFPELVAHRQGETIERVQQGGNTEITEYINRELNFNLTNYRELASRVNWLLDRVRVTLEQSEDEARYMVVEFIAPGKTRNDDGNWRFILKPDDVQLQMRRSGTWTASDVWHG